MSAGLDCRPVPGQPRGAVRSPTTMRRQPVQALGGRLTEISLDSLNAGDSWTNWRSSEVIFGWQSHTNHRPSAWIRRYLTSRWYPDPG